MADHSAQTAFLVAPGAVATASPTATAATGAAAEHAAGVALRDVLELIERAACELRAPLAAISAHLPALAPSLRAPDPLVQRQALDAIGRETALVSDALANLAELAALRAGLAPVRMASVELGDLLMAIMAQWKTRAPAQTFELALPGYLPTILGDEQRIERAIALLLTTAVALAPAGDVIRVSLRAHHDQVVISVRQHGPSLGTGDLSALFEPFTPVPGGEELPAVAGLGPALARAIVEAHGGRAWAEQPASGGGLLLVSVWPTQPTVPAGKSSASDAHAEAASAERALAGVPAASDGARLAVERSRQVVLVAHSDARMARYLRANLEAARYHVTTAGEWDELMRLIDLEEPELLLVDEHLLGGGAPDAPGRLRAYAQAPVIVLARQADPIACARALDAGAADYVALPLSIEELLARARVALRSSTVPAATPGGEETFRCGELELDFAQRLVRMAGQPVALSKTEYRLLRALAQHAGMVLAHEVLLERVWGPAYGHEVEFVWVYIRRLRRKIEPDPRHPRYILTVPGVGYRLAREV